MSSTIFPSLYGEDLYRAQTRNTSSLPGITAPSFFCLRCQQSRLIQGRRRLGKGYVCRHCVEAREALKHARKDHDQEVEKLVA